MNIPFDRLQFLSSHIRMGLENLYQLKNTEGNHIYNPPSHISVAWEPLIFLLTFLTSPWKVAFELCVLPNSCRGLLCNGERSHQLCTASFSLLVLGDKNTKESSENVILLGKILDYLWWITFSPVFPYLVLTFQTFFWYFVFWSYLAL